MAATTWRARAARVAGGEEEGLTVVAFGRTPCNVAEALLIIGRRDLQLRSEGGKVDIVDQ